MDKSHHESKHKNNALGPHQDQASNISKNNRHQETFCVLHPRSSRPPGRSHFPLIEIRR